MAENDQKKKRVEFNAASVDVESRTDLYDSILANMMSHATASNRSGKSSILLHGDPGTGKTSAVRELASILGLDLVVIEAPHITEEHIINIPFITFKNMKDEGKAGEEKLNQDYEVILADSALFTELEKAKKRSDEELLSFIGSAPKNVKALWENLGGDDDTIPESIQQVRKKFNVILFLDEFFRQSSKRIRNMLRSILNGKIGLHSMPTHAYTMYASNINDEGVELGDTNEEFKAVEVEKPNKNEWFKWFVSKFENEGGGKHLNKDVVNEFFTQLEEDHLSFNDLASEVRLSPRRWEQILLYISTSLPVKDQKDAEALIKNVKSSFKNYETGEHAELVDTVIQSVVDLIRDHGYDGPLNMDGTSDLNWRDTLKHQIEAKMKLGEHRKYIPVISGLPGIGKTSHIYQVAKELDMVDVHIDCSTILGTEDVQGIPVEKQGAVNFTIPKLLTVIHKDIEKSEKAFLSTKTEEQRKQWQNKKYKYIIFFDELNRTSKPVFNALRRVILEKSFSEQYKLPEGSVVIAAINPTGSAVTEMTSHLKDVVDVIDAKTSWDSVLKYINNIEEPEGEFGKESKTIALQAVESVLEQLKSTDKSHRGMAQLYPVIGNEGVYMSPRYVTNLTTDMMKHLQLKFNRYKKLMLSGEEEKIEKVKNVLYDTIFQEFKATFTSMLKGENLGGFFETLKEFIYHHVVFGEGVFYKKNATMSLDTILEPHWRNPELKELEEDAHLTNYLSSTQPKKVAEDLYNFIAHKLETTPMDQYANFFHAMLPGLVYGKTTGPEQGSISRLNQFFRNFAAALHYNNISHDVREVIARVIAGDPKNTAANTPENSIVVLISKVYLPKYKKAVEQQMHRADPNDSTSPWVHNDGVNPDQWPTFANISKTNNQIVYSIREYFKDLAKHV